MNQAILCMQNIQINKIHTIRSFANRVKLNSCSLREIPLPEVNSTGWDSQFMMSPWSCRIWGTGIVRTTISNCSGEPVSLETSHLSFLRLIWVTHCLKQISAPVPKAKSYSRKQNFPCEKRGREESPTGSAWVNRWCSLSSMSSGVHFLYFFSHLVGIPLLLALLDLPINACSGGKILLQFIIIVTIAIFY